MILLLLAASLVITACSPPAPGSIAARVQQAKREGRTAIQIAGDTYEPTEGTLATLTGDYSLILTSPIRLGVARSLEENAIYTWSIFRVVETLSRRDNSSSRACTLKPPSSVSLGPGEVARPTIGGTLVVDGVSITQRAREWTPQSSGGTFVIGAILCSDNVAVFPTYGGDVFRVTERGKLVTELRWLQLFDYQEEMESLGTLDNLREYLRSGRKAP